MSRYGIVVSRGVVRNSRVARAVGLPIFGAGGISGEIVQNCSVEDVTDAADSTALAYGIFAGVVATVSVRNVGGLGPVRHISGGTVTDSRIERSEILFQATGMDVGIDARLVDRCQVVGLQAHTSGSWQGIRGIQVRNSVVERVGNSGPGATTGIVAGTMSTSGTTTVLGSGLHAEGNTVSGVSGVGISSNNGPARVVGNLVRATSSHAIGDVGNGLIAPNTIYLELRSTGDGIQTFGTVVSDNHVTNLGSGIGIRVAFAGAVFRNVVSGVGVGYRFVGNSRAAPVVNGPGTTAFDPLANIKL